MEQILSIPNNLKQFLLDLPYQNYHKHSSYSNPSTPDSGAFSYDYAKRARELNHGILSSCEHGFQGNYWETYDLCEESDADYIYRVENEFKTLKLENMIFKSDDNKEKAKYYEANCEKFEFCKRKNLKFIFGAEAYWVKDMYEKDRTNSHICVFARNEKGRRAINKALSKANKEGYYFKPRLDIETILSLPPKDVFLTSACIAFFKYDDIEDIIVKLHNHFKDNFMLEVQYHNTKSQKEINTKILKWSKKYQIQTIMGCDSHFIYENQKIDRDYILKFKNIVYEDEGGWLMDYPTTIEAFKRFKRQGILSDLEILNSINNTNLFLEFEDIFLDKEIKLPSIVPNKTQEEKNDLYKSLIMKEWKNYKKENHISKKEEKRYIEGIKKEVKTVINTNMADYFILDYFLVKMAVKKGGIITNSGRGSAVSFFTNTLLGFSKVDRFISPVHLYPERFMSEARILKTKSLPDLDLNLGNPEVFAEVQEELLGVGHSFPMIAYGTLQVKAAWKMYAGANDIAPDLADVVSKQIEKYEDALKYAEEDEKDTIDIKDYVSSEYIELLEESEKYQGIIMDKKKHACGYLIYSGDIEEEIGLIKCKSKTSKKEYIVALIDGKMADKYKFLKNDLLKVDVSLTSNMIANRIGIKEPSIRELTELVRGNKKVWDIYKNGFTLGINQCEKKSTTRKVQEYLPQNEAELASFIAAIRPSFKSMYGVFSKRETFKYNIESFDKIVQTEFIKDSFIFFQEQIMGALNFAGIAMDETMTLIKAISKKNKKTILSYKENFIKGFSEKLKEMEGKSTDESILLSEKVWQIIEDSAAYGFNASHAYCMACDSLYGAYYKSHYPFEFYETMLEVYSRKGKKDKVSAFIQEMDLAFNIKLGDMKFKLDNRQYTYDKEQFCIYPALVGIKGIGTNDSKELYSLSENNEYNDFLKVIKDIKEKTKVDDGKFKTLIKLDYFSEFGKSKKLLDILEVYNNLSGRKQLSKTDLAKFNITEHIIKKYSDKETAKLYKEIDNDGLIKELISSIEDLDIPLKEKIKSEIELLGYPSTKIENINGDLVYIIKIDEFKNKRSNTYYTTVYDLKTGKDIRYRVSEYLTYMDYPFKEGDIIRIVNQHKSNKKKNVDGKWIKLANEFNNMLDWWEIY